MSETIHQATADLGAAIEAAEKANEAVRAARATLARVKAQVAAERAADAKRAVNRDRAEAKRLAARWGFEIEPDDMGSGRLYWVHAPAGLYATEEADPFNGRRICTSWSEIVVIARTYAQAADAARVAKLKAE